MKNNKRKEILKGFTFVLLTLGVFAAVCILGALCKSLVYIGIFLKHNYVLLIILAVVLIGLYIKSLYRKWKER